MILTVGLFKCTQMSLKELDTHYMEDALESYKNDHGCKEDTELSVDDLKEICNIF